jgi:hypothetical protein
MYGLRCFARAVAPPLSTALPCTYVEDAGNATLYFVLKLADPSALALFTEGTLLEIALDLIYVCLCF